MKGRRCAGGGVNRGIGLGVVVGGGDGVVVVLEGRGFLVVIPRRRAGGGHGCAYAELVIGLG